MVDISGKFSTLREAAATARVVCQAETIRRIESNSLPKGNLFDVARAAAFLGGKKTADLIPHCHPVSIDAMEVDFSLHYGEDDNPHNRPAVLISVRARSVGKTGIEMEVLTAASIAALVIYDLLKPIDKQLEIRKVTLEEKKGGKTDARMKVPAGLKTAILVCSDSTARGEREDKSGALVKEFLLKHGLEVNAYAVVPDDIEAIQSQIRLWVEEKIDFIFTSGGTGLGPRDNTVEAIVPLLEKQLDGVAEAMRAHGQARTPVAMLSRSFAGSIGKTVVTALPGSSGGVKESLQAVLPALFHARSMLGGGGH